MENILCGPLGEVTQRDPRHIDSVKYMMVCSEIEQMNAFYFNSFGRMTGIFERDNCGE
jgi:hypothetical protein